MKFVLLCSDLASLSASLPAERTSVQFIILHESKQSRAIRAVLKQGGHAKELSRTELFRERSTAFRSAYVRALGALNAQCGSANWWAMPFTTKNPISTSLCRDTFEFLLVAELVNTATAGLIVVTDNVRVAGELCRWGAAQHVPIINKVKSFQSLQKRVMAIGPVVILLLTMRALWFRLTECRIDFSALRHRPDLTAIVTLVHPHSFSPKGEFRDSYFGRLAEQLCAWNVPVVVVGQIQGLSRRLTKQFRGKAIFKTVACEALLSIGQILRCGWDALVQWWQSDREWKEGRLVLHGVLLTGLLRSAIQQAHSSGDVFRSLFAFKSAERWARLLRPARCFYPFENRAWEKMLLLGVRRGSPLTQMVGYNHASITGSHLNFMLKDDEREKMPLPDRVITMGAVTMSWLEKHGGYPPQLLTLGCALRQSAPARARSLKARRNERVCRLLIALATSQLEYINTLLYLQEALESHLSEGLGGITVRIRPHPTLPLGQALEVLAPAVTFPFEVSNGTVDQDLEWADVVLYASSTMGIEAVRAGIPAVYMDLGDILNSDPMEGWTEFKWIAKRPSDLLPVLSDIQMRGEAEFTLRQRHGREYAEAYLAAVTDERLQVFQTI
jgi:hypothetical protein